jgi:pyruvate/2-oxoglutarate dehydrogenase complex dihydrolipoamide dehydrogenase (E3) component
MHAGIEISPHDDHNRELIARTHPPDWVNPVPRNPYNLVVIGGGTAGLVTAAGAAMVGARVALVERHLLGGDCLVTGCVPSKTLIRSARAAHDARRAMRLGVQVGEVRVDFEQVMARVRAVRARISHHDSAERFRALGVDVFLGAGRFTGPGSLQVSGARLEFARAVIATGSRPRTPGIRGLQEAGFLTNETIFNLTTRPARLAVLGGGPVGCELAQAFARLGSEVTLIQNGPRLLAHDHPQASALIASAFTKEGITVLLGATTTAVERRGALKQITVVHGGRTSIVDADEILVAVGRAPNVEGLGLEAAGVSATDRGIEVNDFLQTTNRAAYAAGDVCLPAKFTHTADASARIVVQNAMFLGRKRVSALTIPWCTFTDPEVAHVGLTPAEAERNGTAIDAVCMPLGRVDRALTDEAEEGFAELLVRRGSGRLLGATVVSTRAGDIVGELSLAITAGIGLDAMAATIHPYPTQAEIVRKCADEWRRRKLTPRVAGIAGLWLGLRRGAQ